MTSPDPVRFGLLGARSWIFDRALRPALEAAAVAELVAVGSEGGPVPDDLAAIDRGGYRGVLDDERVEAVYVPLANGLHLAWVVEAARAGKHVLCEKPLGRDAAETGAILDAGSANGVLVAEAWMTPFDRRWRQALALATGGGLGEIRHVDATFTFTIDPGSDNYRWRADQGGGALLDVGIYCLGPIAALLGTDPAEVEALAVMTPVGPGPVDARTEARLTFDGGATAHLVCSFRDEEQQRLEIIGSTGSLLLDGSAHTGGPEATDIELTDETGERHIVTTDGGAPYRLMVEAFSEAVRGRAPWPRPPAEVRSLAVLMDRVRAAAA